MGLFSFLHRKSDPVEEPTPAPVVEEKTESAPKRQETSKAPELNPNMPVVLYELKHPNDALMQCRVDAVETDAVRLGRIPGELSLPIVKPGVYVILKGYDADLEPVTCQAVIHKSTAAECVVNKCQVKTYENHRRAQRLPVSVPGEIYANDDKRFNNPVECQVIDISTGGACIVSSRTYKVGDQFRLRTELVKGSGHVSYPCEVVRVSPHDGFKQEYGLLFLEFDGWKMKELRIDLEDIKKGAEKRMHR